MTTPMPELPKPDTHCFDEDTGLDCWSYSAEQMKAYALAAIAAASQPDPYIAELIDRLRDKTDIIPDMTVRQANAHLVGLCDDAADALEAAYNTKGLT